jgi:peptidoglycan/xylan/chitin deacetylase (PgdA/CDA1 family)
MMKNKKPILIILSFLIAVAVFYFFRAIPRYAVPILMYHDIGYGEGSFFVTPENFNRQMEYIRKHGYEVISLDDLVSAIRDKRPLRGKKVVITFDDGYKNVLKYAYPVLKKYAFPATVFIITDFTGRKSAFLNWDEVTLMSRNGIFFGSHTRSHKYLGGALSEKELQDELRGSKKAIEERTGVPADYLCYPVGGFNARVKVEAARAGYKGACTTNRGFARLNRDPYELKRIKVTNADTVKPFSFPVKLSGYYYVLRKDRKPY